MRNQRAFFLVLEGIDGAGTSTQSRILEQHLSLRGLEVVTTNEPWESFYGKEIRRRLRGESDAMFDGLDFARLFVADSAIHNERVISPALKENKIVISDRYRLSSFAYQTTQEVPYERIMRLHEAEDLAIPNLTIYFDLDVETALSRGKGSEKFEQHPFLKKVVENYKTAIERKLKYVGQVVSIDATKPLDIVSERIFRIFDDFYYGY